MGDRAGEPTLGVNHTTGKVMFVAGTSTLQVAYDPCASPAKGTWTDVSPPDGSPVSLDPILFTDSEAAPDTTTNRCFVSQLLGKASDLHYTDDDGATWTRSQGSGINSGVDHQSIGAGPYAPGYGLPLPNQAYPRAVYYCSQDAADANCARSDTGGLTFGPAVPIYTLARCSGIHGHVRVAPDGTVYVPNRNCAKSPTYPVLDQGQTVVVSNDNGLTWNVRTPPAASKNGPSDPSLGIGKNGTIYMGYANGDGIPRVAVSSDKGATWKSDTDIGSAVGVKNSVFPAAVAGDDDRAAIAFLGSTTGGDSSDQATFQGVWHLYVASTFDGGATWETTDLTPTDPVQRGSICMRGTSCTNTPDDRNLLDFMDVTLDAQGRILVGFADGCIDACVAGGDNSYTAKATIARQRSGRRLFAAYDEAPSTTPGAPGVTLTRDNAVTAHLSWAVPEAGASPILGYRVYRSTQESAGYTLLAETTIPKYDDRSGDPDTNYWYRVTAYSAEGESAFCRQVGTVDVPLAETPCVAGGMTVLTDVGGDESTGESQHDFRRAMISEPYGTGAETLVFTMKVRGFDNPPTPSTTWPVLMTRTAPGGVKSGYQVAMSTSAVGAVSYTVRPAAITTAGYGTPGTAVPADSGSYAADGTIRIVVAKSKLGGIGPTDTLSDFLTRIAVGVAVTLTPDNAPDSLAPGGTPYTVVGNEFCRPNVAPLAAFELTPDEGEAPLTVDFDASASSDADGDGIALYTFDFGDGTSPVTQNTPTISHTYTEVGEYRAAVRVNDDRGALSSNIATKMLDVEPPEESNADLALDKFADRASLTVGEIVTWTVKVTNGGPAQATNTAIVDFVPDNVTVTSASTPIGACTADGNRLLCPLGTLANGSSRSATIKARANAAGSAANVASVSSAEHDPDVSNNGDGVSSTVTAANVTTTTSSTTVSTTTSTTPPTSTTIRSDSQPVARRAGYTLVAADGGIFNFATPFFGSTGDLQLARPIVGMAGQPDGRGYRFVAADGGVFSFGDAAFHGSVRTRLGGGEPATPATSMAVTPTGNGYWVVTAGGEVFAFGDAPLVGFLAASTSDPIVAIVGSGTGRGYWLISRQGDIHTFGDAPDVGSLKADLGGRTLRVPLVAATATPTGRGLLLVGGDGGVFTMGDASFHGSLPDVLGGRLPNQPIVGIASTSSGRGYWLAAADGGVFTFGDAPFLGSMGAVRLNRPVVGMSAKS